MSNGRIDLDLSKKTDYKKFKKWYKKSSTKEVCDSIHDMVQKGDNFYLNLAYISNYVDKKTRTFSKMITILIGALSITFLANYIVSLLITLFSKVTHFKKIFFNFYSADRKKDNFTLDMPRYPQDINIHGYISNSTFFTAWIITILITVFIVLVINYGKKTVAVMNHVYNDTYQKDGVVKKYIDMFESSKNN